MAKRVKITQKDLKGPDQFISSTEVLLAYCSQYRSAVIGVAVGLVILIGGLIGYLYNQDVQALRMESLFYEVEQVRARKDVKPEEMTVQLEKLLGQFSEGPQKQRTRLSVADTFYQNKQYDKAIRLYSEIMEGSGPEELHYPLAQVGRAYALEGKKEYANAIDAYKKVIGESRGFPLFDVYLGLSRCYELNSDAKGALLVLREMQSKFSSHALRDVVDRRIKKLSAMA